MKGKLRCSPVGLQKVKHLLGSVNCIVLPGCWDKVGGGWRSDGMEHRVFCLRSPRSHPLTSTIWGRNKCFNHEGTFPLERVAEHGCSLEQLHICGHNWILLDHFEFYAAAGAHCIRCQNGNFKRSKIAFLASFSPSLLWMSHNEYV